MKSVVRHLPLKRERGSVTLTSEVLAFTVVGMLALVSYEMMYKASCQASNTSNATQWMNCDSVLDCVSVSYSSSSSSSSSSGSNVRVITDGNVVEYDSDSARVVSITTDVSQLDSDYQLDSYTDADLRYSKVTTKSTVTTTSEEDQSDACNLLASFYESQSTSTSTSTSSSSTSTGGGGSSSGGDDRGESPNQQAVDFMETTPIE